MCTQSTTQYKV
uniref:Uncharacterized protein n=1 Tax=Anguilla anguilla TaxID=7936 RepID=A0A0E9URH0_ANGAN